MFLRRANTWRVWRQSLLAQRCVSWRDSWRCTSVGQAAPCSTAKDARAWSEVASPYFSDRGPGFYHRKWGTITGDYETACRSAGFTPWAGTNSKEGPRAQPPDIGDVLLHETAISWLRREEESTRPRKPWEETPPMLGKRIQTAVNKINKEFDVRGLCMEFPDRLNTLIKVTGGDRLPK